MGLFVEALDREVDELMTAGRAPALHRRSRAARRAAAGAHRAGRSAHRAQRAPAAAGRGQLRRPLGHPERGAPRRRALRARRARRPARSTRPSSPLALQLAGLPDPDLFIRTGGERRISNFLLWNLAYTRAVVHRRAVAGLRRAEFRAALEHFAGRERRFGLTGEQVARPPRACAREGPHPERVVMIAVVIGVLLWAPAWLTRRRGRGRVLACAWEWSAFLRGGLRAPSASRSCVVVAVLLAGAWFATGDPDGLRVLLGVAAAWWLVALRAAVARASRSSRACWPGSPACWCSYRHWRRADAPAGRARAWRRMDALRAGARVGRRHRRVLRGQGVRPPPARAARSLRARRGKASRAACCSPALCAVGWRAAWLRAARRAAGRRESRGGGVQRRRRPDGKPASSASPA